MNHIRNHMLLAADMAAGRRATTRVGTVTSYDPDGHAAVVQLHPDSALTGWLPVASQWIGAGWGLFAPPTPGDLVEVQFVDDNLEVGFICQRFFTNKNVPLNVDSGEFWLVHKLGAFLKLTNDGKLTVTDKAGSTVVLNGDGTATATAAGGLTINANTQLNGNLVVSGDISDRNGTKGTLQHVRDNYDAHTHPDAQGGNTGTPSNTL